MPAGFKPVGLCASIVLGRRMLQRHCKYTTGEVMLMKLYRSIGLVVCLSTLSIVGCSEDGGEASASATGGEQVQPASFAMTSDPAEVGKEVASAETLDDASKPKITGRGNPTSKPALDGDDFSRRKLDYNLSSNSGIGTARNSANNSTSSNPDDYIVKAVPASLDLGEIGSGNKAKGSFKLVNTGDKTMRILSCKGNCGCTVPKCPRNTEIKPGESYVVEVVMTGKKAGRQIQKVDIVVEGQPKLSVPITADVVTYVEISPRIIGPTVNSDGRIVIRSLDNTPFRIISMIPPLIEDGIDIQSEPQLEHVLFLSWDVWKEKGSPRLLKFRTDHPLKNEMSISVQARRSPIANPRARVPVATINPANAAAARNGDVEKILAVTKTKEDLELIDTSGMTLLGIAARAGQTEVVNILLEAKAKPNAMDRRGRTPLMAAIQKRDTNIQTINALIAGGADVNARDRSAGASVLIWAAGPLGSAGEVSALLEAGSNVNVVDARGNTPLIWAVRFGSADTVKAMLQAGADVNATNKEGKSALTYISQRQVAKASIISEITSLLQEGTKPQE